MSFKAKILITLMAIVAFDAIASFISKAFRVDYSNFMWLSFVLYVAVGFWGAHRKGFVYGMLLGAFAGLVDSTVGWFVSRMIGPFLPTDIPKLEPLIIAIVIIVVTTSAFALGSLGALLCKLLGRTKTADA
jgi:hypothetical protein